jgi:hypothetical protein
MASRFEFDPANRTLLARFEGSLNDESAGECYRAFRKYSTATDAHAGILDLSFVTEITVSSDFVRELAEREPAMPDAATRPRILVVPATVGFGLARMFQIVGESKRPLLKVVRTMDEALAALGIQSAHFKPVEQLFPKQTQKELDSRVQDYC